MGAKFSFLIHTEDLLVQMVCLPSCYLPAQAPHPPLPPGYSDMGPFGQDGSDRNIWVTTGLLPLLPTCQEREKLPYPQKGASGEGRLWRPRGAQRPPPYCKALMISWLGTPERSKVLETLPGFSEEGLT